MDHISQYKTMKLPEGNIRETFSEGKFSQIKYKQHSLYKKIGKLDFDKIQNFPFFPQKGTIQRMKRWATVEKKYLQIVYLIKRYIKTLYSTIKTQ